MARYKIISTDNIIVADQAFVDEVYPNDYQLLPDIVIPEPRYISVGAFYDRFGNEKWPVLADTSPMVQALIKDTSVRKYINLDDPQVPAGLNMVKAAGHNIDVDAIINDPIQPNERPQ